MMAGEAIATARIRKAISRSDLRIIVWSYYCTATVTAKTDCPFANRGRPIAQTLAMKRSYLFAIGVQLGSLMMSAQSQPHTYRGVIVNANCFQAAQIVNRNSRGYVPSSGTNAFTGNRYKPLNTVSIRKSILKH